MFAVCVIVEFSVFVLLFNAVLVAYVSLTDEVILLAVCVIVEFSVFVAEFKADFVAYVSLTDEVI